MLRQLGLLMPFVSTPSQNLPIWNPNSSIPFIIKLTTVRENLNNENLFFNVPLKKHLATCYILNFPILLYKNLLLLQGGKVESITSITADGSTTLRIDNTEQGKLGKGSYGFVLKAERDGKKRAVKTVKICEENEFVELGDTRREIRVWEKLSNLKHANILQLHGMFHDAVFLELQPAKILSGAQLQDMFPCKDIDVVFQDQIHAVHFDKDTTQYVNVVGIRTKGLTQ